MPHETNLKRLTSIVAIDRNGAIGSHNSLPWRLKSDLSFFREKTLNNTVVMGRKTYDSIGKCLPKRMNIVLSHNFDLFPSTETCRIALSLEEAAYRAEQNDTEEIFIIGGAMTYLEFAPYVDRYLVTVVDHIVPDADAFLAPSILQDFAGWPQEERRKFPAVEGQDEFPFSVFEICPSDVDARRERRRGLIREFARQIRSKPSRTTPHRRSTGGSHQLSLI